MNRFKHFIFAMVAAMAVNAAGAATVYIPLWSQNFEDPQTYTNELWHGRVQCSLLGTTALELQSLADWGKYAASTQSINQTPDDCECTISPETRTRQVNGVDAGTSTFMRGFMRKKSNGGRDTDLVFRLPDEVVAAISEEGSYAIDFDYYLAPSFSNGSNTATNGLVIATVDGNAIAVFGTKPNGSGNAAIGEIYTADSPEARAKGGITVGPRGSSDSKGLWMHVSLRAAGEGVTMDVVQENGSVLLSGARLTDSFAVIDRLYLHSHVNIYNANVCLDNVTVSSGVHVADEEYHYTWTNGGGDGKWGNAANWSVAGIVGVGVPGTADKVVFPADGGPWPVTLDTDVTVARIVANGAVSLSGGKKLMCSDFSGDGTLALSGVTLHANSANISITNNLEITAGTTNYIWLAVGKQYYDCHLYGNMTGAGYLDVRIATDGGADRGMKFHGDNTAFAGTFASSVYWGRNGISFDSAACSSADAVWLFDNNYPKDNTQSALFTPTTDTYRFGAFQGRMKSGSGRRKVEFGARSDVLTEVTLSNRHTNSGDRQGGFDVTKVGNGTATFRTATENGSPNTDSIETFDIQGGSVLLASPAQMQVLSFTGNGGVLGIAGNVTLDPSPFIKNSTAPICFRNIGGELHAWGSPLAASNTGGLVKLGEGTLVLAQPPQYEGETTVREGLLVVSNANDIAITPGPATCLTIDEYGTATLGPPPPGAVAMAGTVPYGEFEDALAACIADPSLTLTLLAQVYDISLPVGASIRLRPDGHEYSFAVADRCRVDTEDALNGVVACSHVWDIVAVAPPDIQNASVEAATNGVTLVLADGSFLVLRDETVDFLWTPDEGFLLNTNALSMIAGEDVNSVPAENLPFAMSEVGIYGGNILRLMDEEGAAAKEFSAPAELETLSVEAQSTAYTMRLDARLDVSNIVFTAGARIVVRPGAAFGDGDKLVAWQAQHSLDGFALAPEFVADGWVIRSELDGLKLYKASRCSVGGTMYSSMESAFAASSDGDTIRLEQDSWLFDRIDIPSGEARTLDLGGHRLNVASFWAVNVGDASCTVTNGEIACLHCGFYVTEGSLALDDCRIDAVGRVAQIRGAGTVDIAPGATLTTQGDDPVVFAVGGFGGRAHVVSRGVARQLCVGVGDATASCIAGNCDDTFGADFTLSSDGGTYVSSSGVGNIYHPETQGGGVEISGGWFSSRPQAGWLAADYDMRSEMLDDVSGWRVFMPMPPADDEQSIAEILSDSADAANLVANIATAGEYGSYRDWVGRHSSRGAMKASRFAWTAFALDAPALICRGEPLEPDDVEIDDFSPPGEGEAFTVVVGLRDFEIGCEAAIARLVKVFGLAGGTSLEPESLSDENVVLAADPAKIEGGKLRLTARPAKPVDGTFFLRVKMKTEGRLPK